MLKQIALVRIYTLLLALVLGGFVWAGFSGTWLTGDDLESVEKADGPGQRQGFHRSSGRRYGGRSSFYHK
jgi:hypothetical protein